MNYSTAYARLELYAQPATEPTLAGDELAALLGEHAVTTDASGVLPTEPGWTPTYSTVGVWAAVREAWLLKAGRASDRFDFTTDAQNFRRSQVIDHCETMAARYARKANQAAPIRDH